MSFSCNVSHADTFHPHLMMCTNMTTILSHQEDLGPSMLDVKYEGLGGTGLVTTPLNMAPNLSECNVSHGGIALLHFPVFLYHLPCCKYGISCPSAWHETELLFSYACLFPQSSVDYSFPNLHGVWYHLDASIIRTILDVPLLFEYWHNHTVPPFLSHSLLISKTNLSNNN